MRLLALDVGNTRLKWGLYEEGSQSPIAHGAEFLENIDRLAETKWANLEPPERIIGCMVAGDAVRRRVEEQLEIWPAHISWVVPSLEAQGLHNGYEYPSRLGSDRWVAMIGALSRIRNQSQSQRKPFVVVMVGTAVTVDAVDENGNFLGGFILPGHGIMLKALFSGTAGLHVPTGEVREFPNNTSDALTSGGTYAIAGAIMRMIQHLAERTGRKPHCYITGGAAWKIVPSLGFEAELVDTLIFDGLLQIANNQLSPA